MKKIKADLKYFLRGLARIAVFVLLFPIWIISAMVCCILWIGGHSDTDNNFFYKILEKINF